MSLRSKAQPPLSRPSHPLLSFYLHPFPFLSFIPYPSSFLWSVAGGRLLRRPDQHDQYRPGHKGDGEEGKGNVVAAGEIKEKSEKGRSTGRENLREQHAQAADRTQGKPAEVIGPDDLTQHEASSEADAVQKETCVDE